MSIKDLLRRIIYGKKSDSQRYIRHLREIGVSVGEDVSIYVPTKTLVDESYPWMIHIGDHVRIAEGAKILTHDYSWSVLKKHFDGEILGASGKVHIGNNVFIGMNAIILRGVEIGDNVIIGAGSVVAKSCASGGVYAGNPARRVCEIEDFHKKRREAQLQEAAELANEYRKRFGVFPPKEIMREYCMLFSDSNTAKNEKWCESIMNLCGNYDESLKFLCENKSVFRDYDEFMNYCIENETHSRMQMKSK